MSFDLTIIGPALVAGLLVLVTHVPLGREVLQRGIIFIDLAVAQIAGLGVIIAHLLGWHLHGWETQLVAFVAAFSGALLLGLTEHKLKQQQEAMIGISFVLAATASILLLANDPHGGDQLKDLLTGQILWVNWSDLMPMAIASMIIGAIWYFMSSTPHRLVFYLIFAAAVTTSVQLVGVYLVFASLIIPVFFARLAGIKGLIIPFFLGLTGYLAGLLGSTTMDLPAGALIVWMMSLIGIIFVLIKSRFRALIN